MAALPLAVAAVASGLVPGCPAWAAGTLLVALALRLLADRYEIEALTPGGAASLRALFPFAVAIGLFAWSPGRAEAAGALLAVALSIEGLVLVSPATSWSRALLLGLSGVEIATVSLRLDGPEAIAPVLGYAAALVGAIAALERSESPLGMAERDAGTRRISAKPSGVAPRGIGFRATLALLAVGLPFGFLLFCALPPSPSARAAASKREAAEASARRAAEARARGGVGGFRGSGSGDQPAGGSEGGPSDPGSEWKTGARTRMRLGFVEHLKNDPTPMLSVRIGAGEHGPAPLRLRGLAYDLFTGTEWIRSPAVARVVRALEAPVGTWQRVASDESDRVLRRVSIRDLAGQPEGPLFLLAEPERIRMTILGEDAAPSLAADGVVYAAGPLPAGATYEEDARDPALDRASLLDAKSTQALAPILSYTRSLPDRVTYEAFAHEAVGNETRPVARADLISAWLGRRCKYSLSLPELDGKRPVLDFLLRARQGPCEYFASAAVLMLRALGHPARYVVGVRGGEWVEEDRAWLFRGTSAHGWCELWLDGIGWHVVDPTPRDETAVDFVSEGESSESGDAIEGERDRGWLSNLFGWGRRRPGLLHDVREGTVAAFTELPPWLRVLLPVALLALFFLLVARRRRAAASATIAGAAIGKIGGPYGRALAALRDAGISRSAAATPGEFVRTAARALPPAAEPFRALTARFELERYGARVASPDERRRMDAEADLVREAAKSRNPPR